MEQERRGFGSSASISGEKLVRGIAARVRRDVDLRLELDELISLGTEGLLDAAARFDPAAGACFETFAYCRIRGAIYDGLRGMSRLPIGIHRRNLAGAAVTQVISLHALAECREDLISRAEAPDDALSSRRLAGRVTLALAALPERERAIVLRHYYQDKRLGLAGLELGLSKSWTSRLHSRALARLRKSLAPYC